MTYAPAPAANVAAICVTLLLCFGLPVALFIILRVRARARILPFFLGCVSFVLFAMVLEQAAHALVLGGPYGGAIAGSAWLSALYGGFMAALFEETGRYIFMRLTMLKDREPQNALMYGAGHGGVEAMLTAGAVYVNNLYYCLMLNAGQAEQALASADAAARPALEQAFAAFSTTAPYIFLIAGVERVMAITLHIALSVLIYTAIRRRRFRFALLAFALHMLVDSVTGIIAGYLPTLLVELAVLVMLVPIALYAAKLYRQAKSDPPVATP